MPRVRINLLPTPNLQVHRPRPPPSNPEQRACHLLEAKEPSLRRGGARWLKALSDPRLELGCYSTSILVRALGDENLDVRSAALEAIEKNLPNVLSRADILSGLAYDLWVEWDDPRKKSLVIPLAGKIGASFALHEPPIASHVPFHLVCGIIVATVSPDPRLAWEAHEAIRAIARNEQNRKRVFWQLRTAVETGYQGYHRAMQVPSPPHTEIQRVARCLIRELGALYKAGNAAPL